MRSQSLQQISPDDYSTNIGETTSLRMPAQRSSRKNELIESYFVIRNQKVLKWLTRLVFLMLTLANIVVIAASILLMQDCRHSLSPLKTLVPKSSSFCNNLGMPALFACCITIFTVFGLGCTGRKLTGYALIVISSVEILQGLTTLTFYQCDRMSNDQVSKTINRSLKSCTLDAHVLWREKSKLPLESPRVSTLNISILDALRRTSSRDIHVSKRDIHSLYLQDKETPQLMTPHAVTAIISKDNEFDTSRIMTKNISEEINVESQENHPNTNELTTTRLSMNSKPGSIKQNLIRDDLCSLDSKVFKNIARRPATTTLNECIDMCGSYLSICLPDNRHDTLESENVRGKDGLPIGDLDIQNFGDKRGKNTQKSDANMLRPPHARTSVEKEEIFGQSSIVLKMCKDVIYARVNSLCHYDNTIMIPLSVCSPFFNIIMSICFIYLASCDQKLKESLEDNGIIVQLTGDNKQDGDWFRRMFSSCQRMFRKKDNDSRQADNYTSFYQKQTSLCCLPYKGQLSPSELNLTEYSNSSTEERFQLKPMSSTNRALSANSVDALQSFISAEHTSIQK